jgi:hypothetical protein
MVCTIAIAAGVVLGSIPFGYGSPVDLLLFVAVMGWIPWACVPMWQRRKLANDAGRPIPPIY